MYRLTSSIFKPYTLSNLKDFADSFRIADKISSPTTMILSIKKDKGYTLCCTVADLNIHRNSRLTYYQINSINTGALIAFLPF